MTTTRKRVWILGALLLLLLALPSSVFIVHQTEVGIVTRFGKPKADLAEPGLHFKLPWPVDHVLRLDRRLLAALVVAGCQAAPAASKAAARVGVQPPCRSPVPGALRDREPRRLQRIDLMLAIPFQLISILDVAVPPFRGGRACGRPASCRGRASRSARGPRSGR